MKKVLFMFLCFVIFTNTVKANEWQEEILEGNNVETEYRYRFYKERIEGEYIRIGTDNDYLYENKEDVIYSKYSSYETACPDEEGYEVEYATKYLYQEILPVQFVKITNLSNGELDVADISFIDNSKGFLFSYEIYDCTDCYNDNYTINADGSLILKIEDSVSLRDLTFILEFFDNGNEAEYELVYSFKEDFALKDLVASTIGNVSITNYQYDDSYKLYYNYSSEQVGYDINIDELIKVNSTEKVCKVREIMTYHYNIIKDYYDNNYYKDITEITDLTEEDKLNYKKDLENYKIFYRYKNDINIEEKSEVNTTDNNFMSNDIKLVKTGVEGRRENYNYLIIFVLSLTLISLILLKYLLKYIKIMSNENDD